MPRSPSPCAPRRRPRWRNGRRRRCEPGSARRDRGSGVVWLLVLCVLLWFGTVAVVLVGGARAERHRAAAAADLAALAGAREAVHGGERACAAASAAAAANGAVLTECRLTGLVIDVRTETRGGRGRGAARAGPAAHRVDA
ncbi:Rv3654c family TadE-like protein [Marinitenerispora sediminis]|uniref:Putative Flp pilus-assembly TadG-like N-terminal domain-containing protein n=1 Tax=Marinitenerispora sediminis TaxID=1931232 RepID=A0A368TBJ3_9ACTN|nr:Rv3654c family TadE-like protein [Marinitenerispora sediminis]RCV53642.1 hypothetical protein DEF28_09910 [Marinitenerispora sediminis]RCV57375.1 hypothetical protein DEF23_10975 [Marinitenerispora sediminis]RCV62346.1 hypothetical protein DEF24_01520 [Marinitenerispora sediminis]